jgi:hypothetical protein
MHCFQIAPGIMQNENFSFFSSTVFFGPTSTTELPTFSHTPSHQVAVADLFCIGLY